MLNSVQYIHVFCILKILIIVKSKDKEFFILNMFTYEKNVNQRFYFENVNIGEECRILVLLYNCERTGKMPHNRFFIECEHGGKYGTESFILIVNLFEKCKIGDF